MSTINSCGNCADTEPADVLFKRTHKHEFEFAEMPFNNWLEYQKERNHITPEANKIILTIRSFLLNKQLVEDNDFKMGLAGTESDIIVGFHTSLCDLRLVLDVLEFIHVPFKKYNEIGLYSAHNDIRFWDFVGIIIPEDCYKKQSYQANLM